MAPEIRDVGLVSGGEADTGLTYRGEHVGGGGGGGGAQPSHRVNG